jgi:hypothetical protein
MTPVAGLLGCLAAKLLNNEALTQQRGNAATRFTPCIPVTFFVDSACRKADIYARAGAGSFGTFKTPDV